MMQYELNFRDYARIFHKRKYIIIGAFIIVVAATFFNLSQQPYIYEASSTVKIEQGKTIAGLLTEWITYNPENVMESEIKIVKSFPVMENVAKRLGLVKDNTPSLEAQAIIADLQGQVAVSKMENTNIIQISVRGQKPEQVMVLANTVAAVYVEQNLADKSKQARSAKQFIAEQLAQLEDRLFKSEEKLRSYGDKASELRMAEPIQSKIIDLQFEVSTLLQKYTEKHPKIIQLKRQINDLEGQFKGMSKEDLEYGRVVREIEINKKLYGMLKEKLEESRIAEAQKVSDISVMDPATLPTDPVEPNKKMGLLIGAVLGAIIGIAVAFFLETMDPSIGTIEDVENVIKSPVLGVVPSIHAEIEAKKQGLFANLWAKGAGVTSEEKRRELDRYVRLFVHYNPNSLVAEAYRNIQANLKISSDKKVFLVTSSGPGEGKTSAVINLGLTCAQSGLKTLLVSTDLRRPSIAKAFGLHRDIGLTEYLEGMLDYDGIVKSVSDMALGEMGFDEILKFPGIENISLISSGDLPSNPVAVLESKRLSLLVEEARKDFDLVIFDSPPVLPIADASVLAPKMDSVILVYEIGRTARQALLRAKVQIESTGAKLSGIILNNIRPQTQSIMFSYPYYYKYRYEEAEKKNAKDKGPRKPD